MFKMSLKYLLCKILKADFFVSGLIDDHTSKMLLPISTNEKTYDINTGQK